jgi:hypothetical protein
MTNSERNEIERALRSEEHMSKRQKLLKRLWRLDRKAVGLPGKTSRENTQDDNAGDGQI